MKLSVIIPVYNGEKTLRRCLDSCLAQTYRDLEVIVVNDGSKDRSQQIIDEYVHKHPSRIKGYTLAVNSGSGKACNLGMSHAVGEYFTFLDDDDVVLMDGYEQAMAYVQETGCDLMMFDAYEVSPDGKERRYLSALDFCNEGSITKQQYFIAKPYPWNKLFHRRFIDMGMRFPEGIWYSYLACIPQLSANASKVVYLKKPLINYVQTTNSMTRNDSFRVKSLDILKAVTILRQNSNQSLFRLECEYLAYYYVLKIAAVRLDAYRQDQYLDELANYMANYYPHWTKNFYVKKEPPAQLRQAVLYYKKKYKVIRLKAKLSKLLHHS